MPETSWPQVWMHLIDQAPAIIAAAAALFAAMYGVKNRNLLHEVKEQGNGLHTALVEKLDNALTENRALRGEQVIDGEGQTPRRGGE